MKSINGMIIMITSKIIYRRSAMISIADGNEILFDGEIRK